MMMNGAQLTLFFWLARSNPLPALFFFTMGIPLGLMTVLETPRKRFLCGYTLIFFLEYICMFQAKYWFIFTIQGLSQIIIMSNYVQLAVM